jgi:hypothetical protein
VKVANRAGWYRRLRWGFGLVVGLVVVLAGALVALQTGLVQGAIASLLERIVASTTGEDATIDRLRIEPFEPAIRLEGLSITSRETGDPIVYVPEIWARLGMNGAKPIASILRIRKPVVFLHLDKDGIREFRNVAHSKGEGGSRGTPWERLRVQDGTVVFYFPGGLALARGLDVTPSRNDDDSRVAVESLVLRHGTMQQEAKNLRWTDVHLGLDRVQFPNLTATFSALSIQGSLDLVPGGQVDANVNLFTNLDSWAAWLPPDRSMDGSASLNVVVKGNSSDPDVSGFLDLAPSAWWNLSNPDRPKGLQAGPLEAAWHLGDENRILVDHAKGSWGGGTFEASATIEPASQKMAVDIHTSQTSLAEALRVTSAAPTAWVDLRADLEASLQGTWSPFLLGGDFQVDTVNFVVKNGPVHPPAPEAGKGSPPAASTILAIPRGHVAGVIAIGEQDVRIRADSLRIPHTAGSANIRIGFDRSLDIQADLSDASLADFAPLGGIGLRGRGHVKASLHGPFHDIDIQGSADVNDLVVLGVPFADHAQVSIEDMDIRDLEFPAFQAIRGQTDYRGKLAIHFNKELTLDTSVQVLEGRISDLTGMFVDLPGVEGKVAGSLDLSGRPYHLDGSARMTLRDVDLVGERFPAGEATAVMRDGIFSLHRLSISRNSDSESILIRGSVGRKYAANFDILTDGLKLQTLDALKRASLPIEGDLRIDGRLGGTLMDLLPFARVVAQNVRHRGTRVPDSRIYAETTADNVVHLTGGLVGDTASVKGELCLDDFGYHFDFDLQSFPLHLVEPIVASGQPLLATADGSVSVRGMRLEPPDVLAVLRNVRVSWGDETLQGQGEWRFSRQGPHLVLSGVRLTGTETDVAVDAERRPDGEIQLDGGGKLDLAWLELFGPDILKSGGSATVKASVQGRLPKPAVSVDVDLGGALLKTAWFPNAFEELEGRIHLAPDGYTFERVHGRTGGGTFEQVGPGFIQAENWVPKSYNLHARLNGARVHYIESLPPVFGDADLSFTGPVGALVMSGQIDVREILFSERIDWESWVLELRQERLTASAAAERANLFDMDIGIKADGTGRIRNNVGNGTLSADLRVVGDTSRPGLVGEVRLEPGSRVFLKEREFEATRGELRFQDPYTYDPDLDFLLQTDLQSRERDYRVSVRVAGPFSDWQTSASSDPALSQADINALLLFGSTQEELEDYGGLGGAIAWEGVDLLSHELGLSTTMVDRLGGNLLQVDRWDIVTGANARGSATISSEPRLVVEKDIGGPWDLTVTGEVNIVQIGDTYMSLEKRIAKRLFMTAFWSSTQEGRSLDIGGAFGTEFTFRWDLD